MVSIDSLTFDLTDCSLEEQSESHRGWMNATGVAHRLHFHPGPPNWPFDLTKPDAASEFYRQQCADNGGAMLSLGQMTIDGVEVLSGLFKYRAPIPGSLAMYFVGILWVPFQECCFQINIEAMEVGPTGGREAAVMLIEKDSWPKSDSPPIVLKSVDELFERIGAAPVRKLPSDDERYDTSFPEHPLSKVRARLIEVAKTLSIDAHGESLNPFRARRGWRFWG